MKQSKIAAVIIYIIAMAFTAMVVSLRPDMLDVDNTFLMGMFYSNSILALCVCLGIMGRV